MPYKWFSLIIRLFSNKIWIDFNYTQLLSVPASPAMEIPVAKAKRPIRTRRQFPLQCARRCSCTNTADERVALTLARIIQRCTRVRVAHANAHLTGRAWMIMRWRSSASWAHVRKPRSPLVSGLWSLCGNNSPLTTPRTNICTRSSA